MGTRLELHEQLCKILDTRYAYFQPPETVKMKYPAIVYELDDIRNEFADDGVNWHYFLHRNLSDITQQTTYTIGFLEFFIKEDN